MQTTPKIDRKTLIRIAALSDTDPRTVARHLYTPPDAPLPRGGAYIARAAVHRAAASMGLTPWVRP